MRPTLSVIITNHDYGRFVAGAVDSALGQSATGVEVVVVDDGSTDASLDVLAAYDGRVTLIAQENRGQAGAFNAGFEASRGDTVCFLDADDAFEPEKAGCVSEALRSEPRAGWCFHTLRYVDGRDGTTLRTAPHHRSGVHDLRTWIRAGWSPFAAPATSGLCFRRSFLAPFMPMPESRDVAISDNYLKTIALAFAPGVHLDEPLASVLVHGNNRSRLRLTRGAVRGRKLLALGSALRARHPSLRVYAWRLAGKGWRLWETAEGIDAGALEAYLRPFSTLERGALRRLHGLVPAGAPQ